MSEIPQELAHALAQRYEVRDLIGRGGMAAVYLAVDLKHHRQVALKVLRPDLAASLGAERFLKEIQIAARLNHPHILGLHDSGESAGFLYYVMPYVEGGSLRQVLERERRLDLAPALAIAGSVADALGYAHRMGVFHRDIKPENILFQQGHPIVGDFGIAKAISTAGGDQLTRTGFPVGTPGYMSPEQAAGMTDLDERTDVYSLAVVAYEMLVGEVPRGWPSEDAVREGRFLEAPASHRSRLAPLGAAVEQALVRAMAIRHEQRTATPAALLEQLHGAPAPALPTPPGRRVYSEDEVERIVRWASELEAQVNTMDGAMTIGGVEKLAAEVGIGPELVRRAAAAAVPLRFPVVPGQHGPVAPALQQARTSWWLGAPTRFVTERVIEGELPDTEYATMVDEIRRFIGNLGQVSQLGRSFTWTAHKLGATERGLEVVVSVRSGHTRITVQENFANLIGAMFGGIGGGMGGGGLGPMLGVLLDVVHVNPFGLFAIIPMWLTVTFATARTSYYYASRKRVRQLTELADRLEAVARELMPARSRLDRASPPPLLKA